MKKIAVALSALLPLFAWAHTGADAGVHHGSALLQGLVHPFAGLDHLAAMLAVGVWSVLSFREQGRGRGMWFVPAAFVTLLLCGGLLGMFGVSLPFVEPMIAASLLVFGLLIANSAVLRLPQSLGVTIVGVFAMFHGLAHGVELQVTGAAAALAGMAAGTMLLHVTGMLLGHCVLARHRWLPRIAGLAVAAVGLSLFAA